MLVFTNDGERSVVQCAAVNGADRAICKKSKGITFLRSSSFSRNKATFHVEMQKYPVTEDRAPLHARDDDRRGRTSSPEGATEPGANHGG
jgi:hypothetical protein